MPDQELWQTATAVRHGVNGLSRRLRMERPASGESLLHLAILSFLHRRGPMTAGELAVAQRVQPQSLTRAFASLQRRELIIRTPDPNDGRRSLLAITGKGLEALRVDMSRRDTWLAAAMRDHLTRTECDLLGLASVLLERLSEVDDLFAVD
jgi:DNA-binding MarR family transcriptional regulator